MIVEQQYHYHTRRAPITGTWRTRTYDLSRSADIARYVARVRYAWPGGYELFAVARDGAVICNDCCRTEYRQIRAFDPRSDFSVVAIATTESLEEREQCAHCSRWFGPDEEHQA